MSNEDLVTLLINCYGKAVLAQTRRAVEQFAPDKLAECDRLVAVS